MRVLLLLMVIESVVGTKGGMLELLRHNKDVK